MEKNIVDILNEVGFNVNYKLNELDGHLFERDLLLNNNKYNNIQNKLPQLKNELSSSCLTFLHNNALSKQKWPLINMVRQILGHYNYDMFPIRKSDGYTKDGIKKYKRFFLIKRKIICSNDKESIN